MHTTGGYMVFTAMTARLTFDLHPGKDQVYWCTADIGWVTGHSYTIYGVMPNRVPTLLYEGAPNFPDPARFWAIVERHRVTQFYSAPTAIRAFMKWGDEHALGHDLSSLRLLGTVGEPINPEAWMWYHRVIGKERCPIVDTWWQTETGGHMLTPLPGATPTKPGSCTLPTLGVDAAIVDDAARNCPRHGRPARDPRALARDAPRDPARPPAIPRHLLDAHRDQDGRPYYFPATAHDADGYFWIMGRRRRDQCQRAPAGTMEVESAAREHPAVARPRSSACPEIKGTGIAAFVTLRESARGCLTTRLRAGTARHVTKEIAIAKPDLLRFTSTLPKTRPGKIMRRLLRDIAAGHGTVGDTTTLEDIGVLARLREEE